MTFVPFVINVGLFVMDNSGRPLETEMIDGESYSVDELLHGLETDNEWWIWYIGLSPEGRSTVDMMLEGK